jgi:NAD(P)-dependent dehydrogenase (short-subunit alcohol dehydrogenase family)
MGVSFEVTGKVAVITGGGGVLCSEMARQLAKAGARVAVLDRTIEKAREVAEAIVKDGGEAVAFEVDVLDKDSLVAARAEVLKAYGRVDILINGAGGNKKEATAGQDQSFFDIPPEAFQWVFNLNLLGTVLSTQVFGEVMAKQGSGSIINISSMSAFTPLTNVVAYSAAKAGVNNFTQWMAVYMNQNFSPNIRVNAIAPGFLLTNQNYYLLVDKKTGGDTERGRSIKAHTPMGRYASPEELIGAIIFLASEASSFVNGVVLPIDGGFSAFSGV